MGSNKLTASRLHQLLRYYPHTGIFTRLTDNGRGCRVGDVAGTLHKRSGYINMYVDGATYTAARLAWLYMTGHHPAHDMDHINGVTTDNRWCNLRDVPVQINMQNTRRANKNNVSGLMGVHWRADRATWTSQLRVDGKSKRLGSFKTPEEAHAAYIKAKRIHHVGFVA